MEFKYGMSLKELKMRSSKQTYKAIKFLSRDDREIKKLTEEDLKVLKHLTRSAKIIDEIYYNLDNPLNAEFEEFLKREIEKGEKKAELSYLHFKSQKGIFSPDAIGNQTTLAKGLEKSLGLGYYPLDLTTEKFAQIISLMIEKNMFAEIKSVLSSRSVVVYDGDYLKGIDIVDYFADDFKRASKEIRKATLYCTDKKFNKFLNLQADAFEKADPMLDAKADKVWATLDKSKFEFTITRECYSDKMTTSLLDYPNIVEALCKHNIEIRPKDEIGARVGLVNKAGTKLLKKLKSLVDIEAKFMPYKGEYKNECETDNISQTAVDVDLVYLAGDEGTYRSSIVTAQNLPNDDKLALKIGGGRRNVYHRQVRKRVNKKLYKNLICEEQYKYFSADADHWAVICHENTHTLGPKVHNKIGKYNSILEEYKADMGMYAFLQEFEDAKMFTEEQTKQIMVSSLTCSFLKGKPTLAQAHRTRSVMICNRMLTEKAIVWEDKRLRFDFDKIKKVTKQMMSEVVKIKIDDSFKEAEEYINKWFVWTEQIAEVAEVIKIYSKMLNGYLEMPLAEEFLKDF